MPVVEKEHDALLNKPRTEAGDLGIPYKPKRLAAR
jgi:hypothetical protein